MVSELFDVYEVNWCDEILLRLVPQRHTWAVTSTRKLNC